MRHGSARKIKVSVTISEDVLEAVDRCADGKKQLTRSSVIDLWLRQAARREAHLKLERDTLDYYASLSAEAQDEDAAWSNAASAQFASLDFGE